MTNIGFLKEHQNCEYCTDPPSPGDKPFEKSPGPGPAYCFVLLLNDCVEIVNQRIQLMLDPVLICDDLALYFELLILRVNDAV